ncbi:prolipoprotein diacylglyceryl transferase [Rhodocytophaga aerolata]|uniref:Phosphatidylglycerol--prolipoprotein diacylglyceryl transferase n=1 Tax=Rhodocytophaga aerolata TaxID=455078 RepID=A0ABT8R8T3_9BACT|nr:prolipoprotein diacylglyceryl transferase [Rhodocytophaga aerolata]MDO1448502.1 prolipoprotein diacylglyceryl transferase [Rhodocytophaga aerolata]
MLQYIVWDVKPEIFTLELFGMEFAPRWYGLLFALGFLIGQQILFHIFRKEGKPESDVETLTVYMVLSTIIGARLGHVLFYEPAEYLRNPIDILKIWEGGLASHGATIGILFALYLYARKKKDQTYLWVVDRIVITVAFAGMLIRLGNLMNSEIYGYQTDLPWGFIFALRGETVAKHPTQIYEALFCLVLFITLFQIWKKRKSAIPDGLLLGIFLVTLFSFRFLVEFLKEPQVEFEADMLLNMGQILSIPAVIAGIVILMIAQKNAKKQAQGITQSAVR